jgi:apolipoprotein N-acyltransferase
MQTITLNLTAEQLSVIDKGLRLVPYGEAAPVVHAINQQLQARFDAKSDERIPQGASGQTPQTEK